MGQFKEHLAEAEKPVWVVLDANTDARAQRPESDDDSDDEDDEDSDYDDDEVDVNVDRRWFVKVPNRKIAEQLCEFSCMEDDGEEDGSGSSAEEVRDWLSDRFHQGTFSGDMSTTWSIAILDDESEAKEEGDMYDAHMDMASEIVDFPYVLNCWLNDDDRKTIKNLK